MLHIVTVHWNDERWIAPQLRALERFAPGAQVWASLNGIDPALGHGFRFAADLAGSHPEKLNELARRVVAEAEESDLLLFLDGDALPIAPVDATILGGHRLAAVRRDENLGQRQPHPCFCLTTVGLWAEIDGDWRRGATWVAANGEAVTDTGGNLMANLAARGIEWRPLLRSNRFDLDPLWFGVYGDVCYHHGAGFRPPLSMLAALDAKRAVRDAAARSRIPARVPILGRLERAIRYRRERRRQAAQVAEYVDDSQALSDEVFGWVRDDPEFFRRFTEPGGDPPPGGRVSERS